MEERLPRLAPDFPLATPGLARGIASRRATVGWGLGAFAGRLGEISAARGGATLTLAMRLVLEAQRQGEPAAWITLAGSIFYPPDAAEAGVDLAALPVVRVPDALRAARVADHLLRSGAFGLVVLDLGAGAALPIPVQTRLGGLATRHGAALVCLTEKEPERPSIGSLVSVRAQAQRMRQGDERFQCRARAVKDKRRGPGWEHVEVCRGPDGLR